LLKAGNTVAFTEGEVRNEEGAMVAKATATFKIVRVRKRPGTQEGDADGDDSGQS
jgi:hypothetical protein